MAKWIEKFESHPVHKILSRIDEIHMDVEEAASSIDSDAVEDLDRILQSLALFKKILGSVDPVFVSIPNLDSANNTLTQIFNELNNFRNDKNKQHLGSANGQINNILAIIQHLNPILSSNGIENIREAATSFRRSASQFMRNIEDDRSKIEKQFSELSEKFRELANDVGNQKGRLDKAITEFQKQFSEAEDRRRTEFANAEKERLDKFANAENSREKEYSSVQQSLQGEYAAAKEKNSNSFEKFMNDSKQSFEEALANFNDTIESTFDIIQKHKNRAEKLIGVITNTGMVGGYQKIANKEQRASMIWHSIAILSLLGLVGFAIYAFASTLSPEVNWGQIFAKAFVSVTFGISAAYAAKQADKHELSELKNRRMELELASIDPYLIDLPEVKRHEIKERLAKRLFARSETNPIQINTKTSGSIIDLLKLALEAIEKLAKSK